MQKRPLLSLVATAIGTTLIAFTFCTHPVPMLVWNASASVPIGLYLLTSGTPQYDDFVLVRTPESAKWLAAERRYLPINIPLIKHIAALAGDDVCARDGAIIVNEKTVAYQLQTDHAGRPLPHWEGCLKLAQDEYFLLAEAPDSFDSRYFGPVPSTNIIGRLMPLWIE